MTNETRVTFAGIYVETIPGDMPQPVSPNIVSSAQYNAGANRRHVMLPEERTGYAFDPQDSWWSVVVPEPTINLVENPSFEYNVASHSFFGWSSTPSAHVDAPFATRGRTCLKMPLAVATNGRVRYTFTASTAGVYTFSLDVYMLAGMNLRLEFQDGSGVLATAPYTARRTEWARYHLTASLKVSGSFFADLVIPFTGKAVDLFTDAWQVENKPYPTTYCDGDMISSTDTLPVRSYFWIGEPHDSVSQRRASASDGGRVASLTDEIHFLTTSILNLSGLESEMDLSAIGSTRQQVYNRSIDQSRNFTLIGRLIACDWSELSQRRGELIRLLRHDNTVERRQIDLIYQPVTDAGIPYGKPLRIRCAYRTGLTGNITNLYQETIPLQFHAADPFLYEMVETNRPLSIPAGWTNNGVWYRDIQGTWNTLKVGATTGDVLAVAFEHDGTIIIGGNFTQLCGDAVTRLAEWDGTNFQQIGDLNASVTGITRGGGNAYTKMFLWGNFTLDGIANLRRVADYDGVNLTELGSGVNDLPRDGIVSPAGTFFVGGDFTQDGPAATTLNYIAWHDPLLGNLNPIGNAVGTPGFDGPVKALVVGRDNYLYVGGSFNNDANLNPMDGFARLNLSLYEDNLQNGVFEQLSTDQTNISRLAVGRDGFIYAYGQIGLNFATWRWTGATWELIGNIVLANNPGIWFDQAGIGWISGIAQAMPLTNDRLFRFVGGDNFLPVPVALDPDNNGYPIDMDFLPDGQIIAAWIEETNAVEGNGALATEIEYDGSAYVRPTIVLRGPMTLVAVINETTGAEIWFRHGASSTAKVVADETLFIELSTGRPRVYSDRRPFLVNLLNLAATTATKFWLQPEKTNVISLYVRDTDGNSAAYLTWTNRHPSIDFSVVYD